MNYIAHSVLHPIATFFEPYMNWHFIMLVFLFIYIGFNKWMQWIKTDQVTKRRNVIDELKEIRERYLENVVKKETEIEKSIVNKFEGAANTLKKFNGNEEMIHKTHLLKIAIQEYIKENTLMKGFHLQNELNDDQLEELKKESETIIKKHQSRPYLLILSFMLPIFVFVTLLFYFRGIDTISFHSAMPITLAILTFFTFVTRKTIWIFLGFSVMGYFFYQHNTGNANFFLFYYFIYLFATKRIFQWFKDKKSTT